MENLPEIETLARRDFGSHSEERDFGRIEWIARDGAIATDELAAAYAVFDPGGSNEEHTHPNCEELVYVIRGEIEHALGDQKTVLRAGDIFVVPRDMPRRLMNTRDRLWQLLIVFSDSAREFVSTGR
jgi:quercetin dioxygenase-like cupin family protein